MSKGKKARLEIRFHSQPYMGEPPVFYSLKYKSKDDSDRTLIENVFRYIDKCFFDLREDPKAQLVLLDGLAFGLAAAEKEGHPNFLLGESHWIEERTNAKETFETCVAKFDDTFVTSMITLSKMDFFAPLCALAFTQYAFERLGPKDGEDFLKMLDSVFFSESPPSSKASDRS